MQVTETEAKANLSKLLARVRAGEEVTITKSGVPVAKLVAITPERRRRKPGRLAGKAYIAPDFNDPLRDEMLAEPEN